MRNVLALLAAAALAGASSGCIYAPLDFGLGELGKPQEITLVDGPEERKILVVRIDGEISDEPDGDGDFLLGGREAMTAQVKDVLDLASRDENRKDLKAVLVRINSPGGGVTASDIIHRELAEWKRKTGKPVVAILMDTAASGGYYVAQAADRIVAHPTCITGSIGVIAWIPNVTGLLGKIGVTVDTYKQGAKKDVGNPFRTPTEEDRTEIDHLLRQMYDQFVDVVASGRKSAGLTPKEVRATEARIFTAREALKAKLVDEVGYFDDAVAAAKKLAKIGEKEDVRVITYERKGIGAGRRTIYSRTLAEPIEATILARGGAGDRNLLKIDAGALAPKSRPVFKYIWIPSSAR